MEPTRKMPALAIALILQPVVYGVRCKDKYIYIGKSKSGVARFAQAHTINIQELDEDHFIDLWYPPDGDILRLEAILIQRFKPRLNINHNPDNHGRPRPRRKSTKRVKVISTYNPESCTFKRTYLKLT